MRRFINSALVLSLVTFPFAWRVVADDVPGIEESSSAKVKLRNVELAEGGVLQGQFLNDAGVPVTEVEIVVTTKHAEHRILTDAAGKFTVEDLKGGQAIIRAGEEVFACQLWKQGTAPPQSIKSIALVKSNGDVLRGNYGQNGTYPRHVSGHAGFRPSLPGRLAALSGKQLLALGLVAGGAIAIAEGANDEDDAS